VPSDKTEKREIARFGGTPQKNSGRGLYQKGDAKLGPFIVDVKEYGKSFGLSKKVWLKISSDAVKCSGEPALNVVLGDTETNRLRLWVVQEDMFEQMMAAWMEKYE